MERAVALHHDHLVLGRYRPLRPLGSGGSGSVWLVRDERSARDVALKVVPREGKAGSRAEREVEAAARLRHPRCLRALALERDDRHVYVAYEYIPGRTLRAGAPSRRARRRRRRRGRAHRCSTHSRTPTARASSTGTSSPRTCMLEESEERRMSVRVLDFGLAQLEEADTLTAVGDVPGTLAYIAPERLAGHDATGAADVWSVGVFLWEALAGRHPFWAISPLETARRVAAGAPSARHPAARPAPEAHGHRRRHALAGSRAAARGEGSAADLRTSWSARSERQRGTTSRTRLAERAGPAALAARLRRLRGLAPPLLPFRLALPRRRRRRRRRAWRAPPPGWVSPSPSRSFRSATCLSASRSCTPPSRCVWFALFAGDARAGFLFLLGPVLAPAQALALLPAACPQRPRSLAQRAARRPRPFPPQSWWRR